MAIELPSFEKMQEIQEKIRDLSIQRGILDLKIKEIEAVIIEKMSKEDKYFINGKSPSMAYITSSSTYLRGEDGSLFEMRKSLERIKTEIEYYKMSLDLMNKMIDVWRTQTANERMLMMSYDKD